MTAICSGCATRWSGHTPAHCSACHRTFASVRLFDAHRSNDTCRAPESLKFSGGTRQRMVLDDRGVWRDAQRMSPAAIDARRTSDAGEAA